MLFKLTLGNVKRSLRDYAVYFFTLVIGVSIFYVFNAIDSQTAFLKMNESTRDIVQLLVELLSGVSVFVSAVLGLLIVYASRFLMKRRSREFALYQLLGMSKGRISAILLTESLFIGLSSLGAGLAVGIGLSQLMSALVADLFEADMSDYHFTVSVFAIIKTAVYFGIMYLVVLLFNGIAIGKCRLITLLQSGRKSEKQRLKNPILCVVVFIIASVGLGYAYKNVTGNFRTLNNKRLLAMIAIGCVTTLLIFWSVSGMLLRIFMSIKKVYHKGLNCFTFRQISSKVNTTVVSMTVICLMLFVTICTLAASFSVRNSLNANIKEYCPADLEIALYRIEDNSVKPIDIKEQYEQAGIELTSGFEDYLLFYMHNTPQLTIKSLCGENYEYLIENYPFLDLDIQLDIIKLSDYNALMEIYGHEKLKLNDDEYTLLCNYTSMTDIYNTLLKSKNDIQLFGKTLYNRDGKCVDGAVYLSSQPINAGIFVVPDSVLENSGSESASIFIGNYSAKTDEEKEKAEENALASYRKAVDRDSLQSKYPDSALTLSVQTKKDITDSSIGLGGIIALIGLYIGVVFLICSGAVLALKTLSDTADSLGRYETLRNIGADEKDITRSLFIQTAVFFLLPLALAVLHSVFGMKFAGFFLEVFGTQGIGISIALTCIMLGIIYGGYFLISYLSQRSMIKK